MRLDDVDAFLAEHRDFFEFLREWWSGLPPVSLTDLIAPGPESVAVVLVDLLKGFTTEGVLASPRIKSVVPCAVKLFSDAHTAGVRDFVIIQDSHPPDSPEFEEFGVHCARGTRESEIVDEITSLPFADEFVVMPKETLDPAVGTDFDPWFDSHDRLKSIIVIGDCTDICIYQTAMHLWTRSYGHRRLANVIVPRDCVQTYDVSVQNAAITRATPHDGDLLHLIFVYHLALCGVNVVDGVVS